MVKKLSLLLSAGLFLATSLNATKQTIVVQEKKQTIVEELMDLWSEKKHPLINKRLLLTLNAPKIAKLFSKMDIIEYVDSLKNKSLIEKIVLHKPLFFFEKILTALSDEFKLEQMVLLKPNTTPILHATINGLCSKMYMSKPPLIFFAPQATTQVISLTKNTTCLLIGEDHFSCSNAEFKNILAHELAHIKHKDSQKYLLYAFVIPACLPIATGLTSLCLAPQKTLETAVIAGGLFGGLYLFKKLFALYEKKILTPMNHKKEIMADKKAAETTEDPQSFIEYFQRRGED
ncbi:MAG: M48 family metalloprotease, partial [bacterium]